MVCNIYDRDLNRIGEVNTYVSLVWDEKYHGIGECQLVVTATPTMRELLKVGRFVGKADRPTLWEIKTTEVKDGNLWANGFTVNYTILSTRVLTWNRGKFNSGANDIEIDAQRAFNNLSLVSSGYAQKAFADYVEFGEPKGIPIKHWEEWHYSDIYSMYESMCIGTDVGFMMRHDKKRKKLVIEFYVGDDRSSSVKFSEDYGNLGELAVIQSEKDFYNVAYVGGAGSGRDREVQEVSFNGETYLGKDRREIFVDAGDISQDDYTETEYKKILRDKGKSVLASLQNKISVNFEISEEDFGKRYDLGDIVGVISKTDGLKIKVRVTAIKQTYENNRVKTEITVGTPMM